MKQTPWTLTITITITISLALLCAGTAHAEWFTKYDDALRSAKAAKRPVLVVLDNPADSEASMSNVTTDPDPTLKMLLAGYELCHIDATTERGRKVAKAYNASTMPTTIILDKTATRIMFKRTGRLSPLDLATALIQYKSGEVQQTMSNFEPSNLNDGST